MYLIAPNFSKSGEIFFAGIMCLKNISLVATTTHVFIQFQKWLSNSVLRLA